ncbi:MAG: helix-turn-helix domain-containing protein [Micromonosporaceae bacterium]|nr:helix-turn-helix domain-containing protein [Micromonosporaceae bacterium]
MEAIAWPTSSTVSRGTARRPGARVVTPPTLAAGPRRVLNIVAAAPTVVRRPYAGRVRTAELLADHPEFAIRVVRCRDDHRGWSAAEPVTGFGMVLVRTGVFRRTGRAGELLADRAVGYLSMPGDEARFAHPVGGDVCTSVQISAGVWEDMRGGATVPGAVYVDARLELEHRLLLRAARSGDLDHAAAERLVRLLAEPAAAGPAPIGDRRTVQAAREAVTAGHPAAAGLLPLARLLGVSPYRLSRSFQRQVGVPLTRFRNRVRVAAALDRLEQGEPSLARLAADLGFADQAHLTRTVRTHLGYTPGGLRRLLGHHRRDTSSMCHNGGTI